MPFMKHIIEPTNISQCPIPPGEPNELECLSNLTLANVIRQLSSLGQHAGRIFDELVQDAVKLNSRSQILTQRIETLKQKCAQLDIQNEEVNIDDINTRKQFKNAVKIDQKVVSRTSMPEAMRMMYENADPPPSLDKLNQFRTDGKDCMKYYTDPGFFFDIWYNGLIKDNETRKNEKKKRNKTKDKNLIKSPIVEQDQIYIIQHQNQQPLKQQQQQQTNTIQAQLYQEQIQQKSYYINQSDDQLQEINLDPPTPPNLMSSSHLPLPPPPPLPSLVESDTASSSSSSLSAPLNNNNNNSTKRLEETKSTRSFLDDINKGRFVLKPTQKDNEFVEKRRRANNLNNDDYRESLKLLGDNSDVAATIDFVRKFRPHVRDSSDEDEENSDWDD